MSKRMRATFKILLATVFVAVLYNACGTPIEFTTGSSNNGPLGGGPLSCEEDPTQQCYEYYDVKDSISVNKVDSRSDILLIFDNSGSMTPENKELADRLDGFVRTLDDLQIDWQLCHTTTDMTTGADQGSIREWRTRNNNNKMVGTGQYVITPQTVDRELIFTTSASAIGSGGSGNEMGITALTSAIGKPGNQSCFRDSAAFSAIIISDEDQKSCGGRCKTHASTVNRDGSDYEKQYREMFAQDRPEYVLGRLAQLWPNKPATVHSIVIRDGDNNCYQQQDKTNPAFFGTVYSQLSKLTNGIVGNICATDYTSQLSSIGTQIHKTLDSISLKCAPLSDPKITDAITFEPLSQFTWEGNKVYFSPPLEAGTQVLVEYQCRRPIQRLGIISYDDATDSKD